MFIELPTCSGSMLLADTERSPARLPSPQPPLPARPSRTQLPLHRHRPRGLPSARPLLQPGLSDLWPVMSSGSTVGASPALPLRGWRSCSAPPELSPRVAVMLGRDPALLSHAALSLIHI